MLQEAKASGKLQTLRAVSQRPEGNENKAQLIGISTLSHTFTVTGQLGQGTASLIVDTGAGITLLRRDVWKGDLNGKLLPWYGCKLVGANGGTLNVVGMVRAMQLGLGGKMFAVDTVIVESLTSEGILGLDFL